MRLTPMKAIRAKCLDCSAGQQGEVRLCQVTSCPLWPLRLGFSRHLQREGTDAARRYDEATAAVERAVGRLPEHQNAPHATNQPQPQEATP